MLSLCLCQLTKSLVSYLISSIYINIVFGAMHWTNKYIVVGEWWLDIDSIDDLTVGITLMFTLMF